MKHFSKERKLYPASDKSLVVRSLGSRRRIVCSFVARPLLNITTPLRQTGNKVSLLHEGSIKLTVTPYMVVSVMAAVLVCSLAAFLYARYRPDQIKQLFHRQKLSRMILENGWYESEQSQDGGFFKDLPLNKTKEKITHFPRVYYRLDNGLIHILAETLGEGNIKTSSCTWKRSWKQACTVSWFLES